MGGFLARNSTCAFWVGTATLAHMAGKYRAAETDVTALGAARCRRGVSAPAFTFRPCPATNRTCSLPRGSAGGTASLQFGAVWR